jgi:hypothetical protein
LDVTILADSIRDSTGVASRRVDGECAVHIPTSLVKLNGLPSILGGLADTRPITNDLLSIWLILILSNGLNASFNLGFPKSQGQI